MKVEQVPIESVIPYAKNPRRNQGAIGKVAASLKEFGWRQPIVVDCEMVIVVGHTRLLAAQRLGMTKVPIPRRRGFHAAPSDARELGEVPADSVGGFVHTGEPIALSDLSDRGVCYTGFAGVEFQDWLRAKETGR